MTDELWRWKKFRSNTGNIKLWQRSQADQEERVAGRGLKAKNSVSSLIYVLEDDNIDTIVMASMKIEYFCFKCVLSKDIMTY